MSCELPANQKKRHWLTAVEQEDQDHFSIGFENKGQAALWWFQQWQVTQTNSDFDFLNDGLLWEYTPGYPEGSTGSWSTYYQMLPSLNEFNGTMWFYGFPNQQTNEFGPYSLEIRQQFWISVANVTFQFWSSKRFRLAPSTTQQFTMAELVRTSGPPYPGGEPNGQMQLTPLARCHDCSTGP